MSRITHPKNGEHITEISELGDAESMLGGEISRGIDIRAALDAARGAEPDRLEDERAKLKSLLDAALDRKEGV